MFVDPTTIVTLTGIITFALVVILGLYMRVWTLWLITIAIIAGIVAAIIMAANVIPMFNAAPIGR